MFDQRISKHGLRSTLPMAVKKIKDILTGKQNGKKIYIFFIFYLATAS